MFYQLGLGERSGYGLESIHKTWKLEHWRKPALEEEFKPERTTLTLLTTSLLPDDVVNFMKFKLRDRFRLLSPDEVLTLVTAYQEKSVSNARIQQLINKHSQDIIKLLSNLVQEGLLVPQGYGRGTKYVLSETFAISDGGFRLDLLNEENTDESSGEVIFTKAFPNNERNENLSEENIENNGVSLEKLVVIAKPARENTRLQPTEMKKLILSLCNEQFLSLSELTHILKREKSGVRRYVRELVEEEKLKLRYPKVPSHKKQAYKSVDKG
ncbi:hypothetical protein [Bacillus benzoevorans]|uniref:Putative HTH transcriptional regulator n=1 Tax=Bacillus benzoevorans TaxID=1456 RepID=A0A7X0LX54_9BACI|nr:hypothetical protein [Bacillus benzoevorans]MBB6446069.1 putative HTH transcriptional regulator [Bacillus benzoevorans]